MQAMQIYTEFLGMTPQEILEEAENEIRQGLLMRERNIENYILDFRDYLENRIPKLTALTIKNRIASIRSFYKYYNIQLPVLPRSVHRATAELKRKDVPTKEDIQAILAVSDPLEKALILVGISSGLSAVDIANLRIHHFTKGFDPETGITTIHITRTKTGFEFHTFLTPETSKAIQDYLDWRNRTGRNESESLYIKNRVYDDNGYLFIRRCIDDAYTETRDEELRGFKKRSINALYAELSNKANASAPKGEYNLIRTHNMRRYFYNTLRDVGFTPENLEYMMAHAVSTTIAGYWRNNPKPLKEEYIKHMHVLTIAKEFDPNKSIEFRMMQQENEKLAKIASTATIENTELQELRAKVEKLEAEKRDMIDDHWIDHFEHEEEQKITAHDFEMQQQKIDELYALVAALTKDIDIDKPLTKAEKKALKDAPEW
jgi:hypothetical protein